jgi:penicillin-binding protein 1C
MCLGFDPMFLARSAIVILSSNQRPDFPADFISSTKLPKVAWKTGTSYGKRDAWAVGYNPDYTIAVWMGNFDGKGANELTGANIAVPLLFELFNAINYNANSDWFKMPDNTFEREVCSETGLLPSENCINLTKDYYIENISLNKKCELRKTIYTDIAEKMQYCPSCMTDSGFKKVNYPFYEPELTLWYLKNKIDIKKISIRIDTHGGRYLEGLNKEISYQIIDKYCGD